MATIGIVAADGELPVLLAAEARREGYKIIGIAVSESSAERLGSAVDALYRRRLGELQGVIDVCKSSGVGAVVFAGKVYKESLFCAGYHPDSRLIAAIGSLGSKRDDSLMSAICREFESEGITVLRQTDLGRRLVAQAGVLTRRGPTDREYEDMRYGFRVAKLLGSEDIGQTVVVRDRTVIAVEAAEGTDQAVLRGGGLAHGRAVVVKVSKPGQDQRFDVPTIGITTIRSMHASGCSALAIEAQATFVTDRSELVDMCDDYGIALVAVDADGSERSALERREGGGGS